MTAEPEPQPIVSKAQSHIIERPRLTKLLDETKAKIIALVAPAGYGKTTLARQWLKNKPTAWYRATPASTDVAALATGIAEAISVIIPGAGEKLRQRLGSPHAPEIDANRLAEILARDLGDWPPDAWLVIDDFHCIVPNPDASGLVDALVSASSAQLLVATRERPSWVSARRLLYAEIFECGQSALSLTKDEALAVLSGGARQRVPSELLERVKGWPVVIGLAAMTPLDLRLPEAPLPARLYDYFAEELYQEAPPDFRAYMRRMAILPSISEKLVTTTLAFEARKTIDDAIRLGFLSPDGKESYELHPLLREFLLNKLAEEDDDLAFVESATRELMRMGRWDDAFTLIERFELQGLIHDLIEHGLSVVLRVGRLATLERWVEHAKAVGLHSPLGHLAEAEIARRRGLADRGEVFALEAAAALPDNDPRTSRAFAVAGECAHHSMRFIDALAHHQAAERLAQSDESARRALWGQFVTSWCLELETGELLERFGKLVGRDVDAKLRFAAGHLLLSTLNGGISKSVDLWGPLVPLVEKATDPLGRTFFCYRLGVSMTSSGRYEESLPIIELARREAEDNDFMFALPHIALCEAGNRIGLRQFPRAALLIDEARELSRQRDDLFTKYNARLVSARLAFARGRFSDALRDTDMEAAQAPTAALQAELLALRALALCTASEWANARALAADAVKTSRETEGQTLGHLVKAVASLHGGSRKRAESTLRVASVVLETTQNLDAFVAVYRVFPELLEQLRPTPKWPVSLSVVVTRARDRKLGVRAGLLNDVKPTPVGLRLTTREREVFRLLCLGLTNKEIAQRLFITEVTAKAHVRNILSKLGVRSRTEAVLRAQADE